jgi:polysaccharide pyruvyl transferase CsaB
MRNKDARILIAGSYGQGNTGDEAILTAIVDQLRARMPDVRLVVVAGDTEAIGQQFGVETVSWADWAVIAQAVERSDMVIQGGGGIFFDYTGFHPWSLFENRASDLAHYGGYSLLANLYRKPFMIYGVGVGPLTTDGGREMVKAAHLLADKIAVRDAESKTLLEEIGIEPSRIELTADPAFSLTPADERRAREILSEHGIDGARPVIGITLRPWDYGITQSEWERSLVDALSGFAHSKQAQILLIPFHKGHDDGPLLRVQQMLVDTDAVILRSEYMPDEIAGVIGACDLLIGMRLHSILFAILTATPAIALAYEPKVRSLTRRIGHEEICLDMTELPMLNNLISSVWERREELSRDFAGFGAEMRPLAERNAEIACALLNAKGADSPSSTLGNDMFAKAFYGRLQAIRVRDRAIAKRDEAKGLQGSAGILKEEPRLVEPAEAARSRPPESLNEFVDMAVTESTEHLVVIYKGRFSKARTNDLVEAFVDCGIPTIFVGEAEDATNPNQLEGHNFFHLPVAALMASSDDVLTVSVPGSCRRVLILRSADLNAFRLINHAHAMNWVTVYYSDQHESKASQSPEAESYVVKNVEYVVVGSESRGEDQVAEIMKLIADPIPKSPVRLAVEGAHHG